MRDFKLTIAGKSVTMSFEWVDSIINNIFLSISVRRGSLFNVPWFGSRLHTIKGVTDKTVSLARIYVYECLEWLVNIGRLKELVVTTSRGAANMSRIDIEVSGKKSNGGDVTFKTFIEVV